MANFRKVIHDGRPQGGNGFITRLVKRVDDNLGEQQDLVVDVPEHFVTPTPSPEVFSLPNRVDAGVNLQEVPSVVFHDSELNQSELDKIESVISSDDPEDVIE